MNDASRCNTRPDIVRENARLSGCGFSLVELLLVIALIGILLALTFPSLRDVRAFARDVGSLSNLRQHGTVLQMYAGDSDGYWPYFLSPEPAASDSRFFEQTWFWDQFLVAVGYYGHSDPNRVFRDPMFRHPGTESGRTGYMYAATHFSRPEYWSLETRSGREQWDGVRASEVTFPSKKSVLVENHPTFGYPFFLQVWHSDGTEAMLPPEGRFAFAMSDGGARREDDSSLLTPIRDGDWHLEEASVFVPTAGLHTVHGVRGRDIE